MADRPLRIVTLPGSIRRGSHNAAIARALPGLAPAGVSVVPAPPIDAIPLYDPDAQAAGFPASVTTLGDALRAADGVVIVSPEYNYSVPGPLKNALDWLSRLPDQPLAGKPVAIQSASPGALGGVRMQAHLRQILIFFDAYVLARPEVMIGQVATKMDESGTITDEATRTHVARQMTAFAAFIRRLMNGSPF